MVGPSSDKPISFKYEPLPRSFVRGRPLMNPNCPYNSFVEEVSAVWQSGRILAVASLAVVLGVVGYASYWAAGQQVLISLALLPLLFGSFYFQAKTWHWAEMRSRSVLRWCFDRSKETDESRIADLDDWVANEIQRNRT